MSSAAKITVLPCKIANPVVLEPGSIFKVQGSTGVLTAFFRMIVLGYSRKTAARPVSQSLSATDDLQGANRLRLVSRTKIKLVDIVVSKLHYWLTFASRLLSVGTFQNTLSAEHCLTV